MGDRDGFSLLVAYIVLDSLVLSLVMVSLASALLHVRCCRLRVAPSRSPDAVRASSLWLVLRMLSFSFY